MNAARPLSQKEIWKVTEFGFEGKYSSRYCSLFKLGCSTGARIGELLGLNVGDVWQYNRPVSTLVFRKDITKTRLMEGSEILIEILNELKSIRTALQIPHEPLITVPEAAELAGIKEGTLRNLIDRGVVTKGVLKVGQKVKIEWRQFLNGLDRSKWMGKKRNDRRTGNSRLRS